MADIVIPADVVDASLEYDREEVDDCRRTAEVDGSAERSDNH